jgi:hypothetical protein
MAECRSCGAPITWAITDKRRRIPLDPEPNPAGNIRLDLTHAHILTKGETYYGPRYMSHFATCPNAAQHRKGRPAGTVRRGSEVR